MIEDDLPSFGDTPLNNSINMDEENERMIRRLTLFFVPIAFAVILVIGLIGNILVIIVVSNIIKTNKWSNCEFCSNG